MLSDLAPRRQPRRHQSLRQEYEEFLLQRIEEFKDQLTRDELLAIADEAVQELEVGPEEQLVLTEVLVLEHVDRLIMQRLNLPTFKRWRTKHRRLRQAQREPTHWALDPRAPVVDLARAEDLTGAALIVGSGAVPVAMFLAAHEWPVVYIDQELTTVEAVETRAAVESLGRELQAFVISLGGWFPDVTPMLTVLDARTLGRLEAEHRNAFLETLRARTPPRGVHCVMPSHTDDDVIALRPETIKAHYDHWHVEHGSVGDPGNWFVVRCP